jgi:hypothetical protein
VSLGTAFTEVFTRTSAQPFATVTRTIVVTEPQSARLVFDHAGGDTSGLLLDDVQLTRVDTGQVLLDDGFELTFPDGPFFLQIVPTLTDLQQGDGSPFHNGGLSLGGSGFIEGGVTIHYGAQTQVDSSMSGLPDVHSGNTGIALSVPAGAPFGPISVSTAGGTSAPFGRSVDRMIAVAASGTPADATAASANPGQAITLEGSGFDATTEVVFVTIDSFAVVRERVVWPSTVNDAGTVLRVVVPAEAITGVVGVVGDRNARAELLQIVPVVSDVDVTSVATSGGSAGVALTGAGFVEGSNTAYRFGAIAVTDASSGSGPDVTFGNDQVSLTLALTPDAFGPVTVQTAGGTSAPFTLGVTAVDGVALSGTPADPGKPSANPEQAFTVRGTGFRLSTDLIMRWTDSGGSSRAFLATPTFAAADGTEATFVVPEFVNGVFPLSMLGATTAAVVQVVPVVEKVAVVGTTTVRLQGAGFVEGNGSLYTMGGAPVPDPSTSTGRTSDFPGSPTTTRPWT